MKNFGGCRCGALCFMRAIISGKKLLITVVDRGPTEKVQAGKNGAYRRRKRACADRQKRPNHFYSQLALPIIETPPTPHPQPNPSQILIGDSVPKCQRPMRVYGIRATQEIHAGV
jgi:hypothetical protein